MLEPGFILPGFSVCLLLPDVLNAFLKGHLQHFCIKRLQDILSRLHFQCIGSVFKILMAGQKQKFPVQFLFPVPLKEFQAASLGHLNVTDDKFYFLPVQNLLCILYVVCLANLLHHKPVPVH